jgi:hypothetical protein
MSDPSWDHLHKLELLMIMFFICINSLFFIYNLHRCVYIYMLRIYISVFSYFLSKSTSSLQALGSSVGVSINLTISI